MCRVHRVVGGFSNSNAPVRTILVYEQEESFSPQTQPYFETAEIPRQSMQFTERLRRTEYDRLTGRTYNMDEIGPERRSPQGNLGNLMPFIRESRWEGMSYPTTRNRGHGGWIHRNLGKKPIYKDRRFRVAGSGLTRPTNVN